MVSGGGNGRRDRRLHVLLIVVALIGSSWLADQDGSSRARPSSYWWVVPQVAGQGRLHRAETLARLREAIGGEMATVRRVFTGTEEECAAWPARLAPFAAAKIPVNRADRETLATLPGIGPTLAARIIAHRRRFGHIRSAGELSAVRGISPSLARRLAAHLCFQ